MARLTFARFVTLGFALALVMAQGCSDQGEGERCEPNSALNSDCDDGLICVPGSQLLDNAENATDFGRCCPEDDSYSDSRCAPRTGGGFVGSGGMGATGGDGGAPASGGASGEGGEPAASGGSAGESSSGGSAGETSGGTANGGAAGAPAGGSGGSGGDTAGSGGA